MSPFSIAFKIASLPITTLASSRAFALSSDLIRLSLLILSSASFSSFSSAALRASLLSASSFVSVASASSSAFASFSTSSSASSAVKPFWNPFTNSALSTAKSSLNLSIYFWICSLISGLLFAYSSNSLTVASTDLSKLSKNAACASASSFASLASASSSAFATSSTSFSTTFAVTPSLKLCTNPVFFSSACFLNSSITFWIFSLISGLLFAYSSNSLTVAFTDLSKLSKNAACASASALAFSAASSADFLFDSSIASSASLAVKPF